MKWLASVHEKFLTASVCQVSCISNLTAITIKKKKKKKKKTAKQTNYKKGANQAPL